MLWKPPLLNLKRKKNSRYYHWIWISACWMNPTDDFSFQCLDYYLCSKSISWDWVSMGSSHRHNRLSIHPQVQCSSAIPFAKMSRAQIVRRRRGPIVSINTKIRQYCNDSTLPTCARVWIWMNCVPLHRLCV